ncbi:MULTISPECIES: DUF4230 domain-containing protein [Lysinibacillus]|uniref:DUF4230 domain-containing protein n=1 Tax=Lysinibacillus antri TaxID=2498145 RepID=A0A3S0P916_9BACI|nr:MULTISPECIES: DUF4230 domain-containing protein [Lysinibacillus]RUL54648.1 DUF4230 domain-containing protein [Lysinibacillus antri]TSI11069.1 DUF4230 domain-containing protein [Lysinibacillus sp. BW-2-10]
MGKKDLLLSQQLESVLRELNAGKEESAATAAIGKSKKSANLSGALFKLLFKFWGVKIVFIALVLALVSSGGIWLFSQSTFKQESTTFVEQVQELATLATSEAYVKVVIEQEDNQLFGQDIQYNLPGTKRHLLLIVPATVIAGVDLKEISFNDIEVDEKEKKLEILLPPATLIQEPAIQMDQVITFSDNGLFREEVKWAKGFDLAAQAQEQIKKEAIEIGLLQTAEENAEKVLKEFFGNLGYSVKVAYK